MKKILLGSIVLGSLWGVEIETNLSAPKIDDSLKIVVDSNSTKSKKISESQELTQAREIYNGKISDFEKDKRLTAIYNNGNIYASMYLGFLFQDSKRLGNPTLAKKWEQKSIDNQVAKRLEELAENGDSYAQNTLGSLYFYGNVGLSKNKTKSVYWCRKSAEQGNHWGQNNLGVSYQYGDGVKKDEDEAFKWYQKSADGGNPTGEYFSAIMYATGKGVAKNNVKALKWYEKSANHGNIYAQKALAWRYKYGKGGVTKDMDKAIYWYRKAGEQGDIQAQHTLGHIYEAKKDKKKARNWYIKASKLENQQNKIKLKKNYKYIPNIVLDKKILQNILDNIVTDENNKEVITLTKYLGETLIALNELKLLTKPSITIETYTLEQLQKYEKTTLTISLFKEYLSDFYYTVGLLTMIDRLRISDKFNNLTYDKNKFNIKESHNNLIKTVKLISTFDEKTIKEKLLFVDIWEEYKVTIPKITGFDIRYNISSLHPEIFSKSKANEDFFIDFPIKK